MNAHVTVAPIYVTTGQTGLVTAKFSNTNTATATHTVITVILPTNAFADDVSPAASCTQTADKQTISCSFGNVRQDETVKMTVKFTSNEPPGDTPIEVKGELRFAEGNDGSNDTVNASGTYLSVPGTPGSDKAGYCTVSATKTVKNKTVPLVDTVDRSGQTATIERLTRLAGGLCTPVGAGVEAMPPNATCGLKACSTHVSVVAFPAPATGTVTLLFPSTKSVPLDASTFVLYELSILDSSTWIEVATCPTKAVGTDTCININGETNVTKNGVKYVQDVLTVEGSPPDGHYGG